MPSKVRFPPARNLPTAVRTSTPFVATSGHSRPVSSSTNNAPTQPLARTAFNSTPSAPMHLQPRVQSLAMSSMPASHGHSGACCNIPPVVSDKYEPKGTYEQLGGLKTYVTGPGDASKGLISIYDIFGFFSQTLQGTDIISTEGYKVFIPDWFKGNPCPIEWYPPDTPEKQQKLGAWFGEHPPQGVAEALPAYVKAAQAANPSIKSWGIIGYCWGGKVVSLVTSSSANPFSVAAVAHPAMVDPADAEDISVPYLLIASKDEDSETIKEFESKLKMPHQVETFTDQIHGFMAARADLSDPHVREEYTRGYETVLGFLSKQWV